MTDPLKLAVGLLLLLATWGVCASPDGTESCAADGNDDGIVDYTDLALFLAAWDAR